MYYGEVKTRIKSLLNIATKGGVMIADTKIIDDLKRMPALINDAQNEIAQKEGLLRSSPLSLFSESPEYKTYGLPAGTRNPLRVEYYGGATQDYLVTGALIRMDGSIENPSLIYECFPEQVAESTDDDFEFEIKNPDIIPYYVASMLSPDADEAQKYMAEYMKRLNDIRKVSRGQRRVTRSGAW